MRIKLHLSGIQGMKYGKSNSQKKGDECLKAVMDERSSRQDLRLIMFFFLITKTASGYSLATLSLHFRFPLSPNNYK